MDDETLSPDAKQRSTQIALLLLLEELERDHAWPTSKSIYELKEVWNWS